MSSCKISLKLGFLRWPSPACHLRFSNCQLLFANMVEMVFIIVPNFIKIGQTVAEISHLTCFRMTAVHHLGFLKKLDFSNNLQDRGQYMSACKISSKSVNPLLR